MRTWSSENEDQSCEANERNGGYEEQERFTSTAIEERPLALLAQGHVLVALAGEELSQAHHLACTSAILPVQRCIELTDIAVVTSFRNRPS